jgi:tetratricopeptide (TPR) repeat protein
MADQEDLDESFFTDQPEAAPPEQQPDPPPAHEASPDGSDPYVAARRRAARMRALGAAAVLVVLVLLVLFRMGQKQSRIDKLVADTEALAGTGGYADLRDASSMASEAASLDELAPAAFFVQGVKSDLALWALYQGSQSVSSKALQMLEAAQTRAPEEPGTVLAGALYDGVRGDPAAALAALDGGKTGPAGPWHAVARAEALVRSGDLAGGRAALESCAASLCKTWAARYAMDLGDWTTARKLGDELVAGRPGHEMGRTAQVLATARGLDSTARIERLQGYMEETDLPPLLLARVVVDLSRALRRAEGPKRADELLERALESTPDASLLAREVARTKRYQGFFGAAWTRADKALRSQPGDPGLLTELSAALFFNDAAELLDGRLQPARDRGTAGDGVRRGQAMMDLIRGLNDQAIAGLEATRHLGEPGDADLFLAEAFLRTKRWSDAVTAAQRAREALEGTFGAGSREAAIARMYEGVAVGLGGDPEAAEVLLDEAYGKDVRTVWGAWLYGRYHEGMERYRDAKDAYLLACHNGQDFAQSCLALADVYDKLEMDGLMRRTQTEARKQYLRQSPKGWRAQRVKTALDK